MIDHLRAYLLTYLLACLGKYLWVLINQVGGESGALATCHIKRDLVGDHPLPRLSRQVSLGLLVTRQGRL